MRPGSGRWCGTCSALQVVHNSALAALYEACFSCCAGCPGDLCDSCTPWAAFLGWVVYGLSPSYRRRLRMNAARAGISRQQRRQSVAEAGKMVMESLRLWLRPPDQPIADPVQWQGEQLIEDALAQGRGLVFLTPHLGSFEVTAQAYAQRYGARRPITVMFRPARYRMLRELEETARARPALATAPAIARRRAADDARAQARRGGRPAARPGAAARHGRVGRFLRRARPTP